jgi:hypothetical protein
MKKLIISLCALSCLITLPMAAAEEAARDRADIDFGTFTPPEDGTFVEVRISKGLLNMATRIAQESEPEMARILGGLNSIRVNVLECDKEQQAEIKARVYDIRSQLDARQWERVVNVREGDEDVGVYVKLNGAESIEGLVVTVITGDEAVLVHVDGRIRPEELAQVGDRLNIQPLQKLGAMMGDK